MREWLDRPRDRLPAVCAGRDAADVGAFAATAGWPVVLKAASGGYDGQGVWVCGDAAAAAAVRPGPRPGGRAAGRAARRVRAGAGGPGRPVPGGQVAAYPVVETVQLTGSATRSRPRSRAGARPAAEARTWPCGWPPSWTSPAARGRAVRDRGRPAGQRAGHAPAQLRALDHRRVADLAVRAAPAGRAEPPAG